MHVDSIQTADFNFDRTLCRTQNEVSNSPRSQVTIEWWLPFPSLFIWIRTDGIDKYYCLFMVYYLLQHPFDPNVFRDIFQEFV